MSTAPQVQAELQALGSPQRAESSAWFFKTGPGQYGEGDMFLGVTMPEQRKVAKQHLNLSLQDLDSLIKGAFHEERMTAIIILTEQFKKGDEATQRVIYDFYLGHTKNINNWDLVDVSAGWIVGGWLEMRDKSVLTKLAQSSSLWERRIAMIATFCYIKNGDPTEALKIAEILLYDEQGLIQKAVGWMLREVGKRCSLDAENEFLNKYYATMPRTTLRYAIERHPAELRQHYMQR